MKAKNAPCSLDKMYSGSAPEHPVAAQLFQTIQHHKPDKELFHRKSEGRTANLFIFLNFLCVYCS